jgi:predicted house-cleaning noncanonical NTP pyrophosphatase (MazG superfamily)
LGRNNIHENLAAKGGTAITRILTDEEYKLALYEKLQEEVGEFLETPIVEELADILEVIHALAPIVAGSWEELEKVRLEKLKIRGGYDKKIFIEEIHDE